MVTEAVKPMAGDVAGNDNGAVTDSRSLVDSLVASGALDPLFERIDGGQIELTGDGGLLGELARVALERGLQAEMTSHLGYAPGDRESKAGGGHANSRNGSYPKTLSTPVGEVTVLVPRDRDGSSPPPRLVPRHSRRLGGLDEMIISLYAGGMTVRDIQHHLEETAGTELSPETISNITDAVSDAVLEWRERPLDEFCPVVCLDAVRVKVRDNGRVTPKAAHIAVGVDMDGFKHVPGIWGQDNEGASFRAHVCAEMANRGMADALIVCCDGLKGLPEAVEATWSKAIVQTCVVHLIRAATGSSPTTTGRGCARRSGACTARPTGRPRKRRSTSSRKASPAGDARRWLPRGNARGTGSSRSCSSRPCSTGWCTPPTASNRSASCARSAATAASSPTTRPWSSCSGWQSATSRANAASNAPKTATKPGAKAREGSSRGGSRPTGNRPSPNSRPHTPNEWNPIYKTHPKHKQLDKLRVLAWP